jgi:hypothetical protein
MSATTATNTPKRYIMTSVFYDEHSDELVSVQSSVCMPVELGVEPTRENQQIAKMVLASCQPKFVERFNQENARRSRRLGPRARQLPTLILDMSRFGELIKAKTVLDLVKAGVIDDPQA